MTKTRITKRIEKKYGKITSEWYDVEEYRRSWMGVIFGILLPLYGWIYIFSFKPYELQWRTLQSFDNLENAKYYLKHDDIYETTQKVIKNVRT